AAEEGFHCYDDMFIWARDLMEECPVVVSAIRDRFPLLFIDEAQDNSETQSAILHRVFVGGDGPVVRQRFGDANQAIFNSVRDTAAGTDAFPDMMSKKNLPNSHRFGQTIADLAAPLGITPLDLRGCGPTKGTTLTPPRHTVFLFDDNTVGEVLDAYARLLIRTFDDQDLRDGVFVAVGQTHKPPDKEEKHKFPHHVAHYWPIYDAELTKPDPRPRTFVQHVLAGQGKAETAGEAYPAVEKLAEGILRLSGMAGTTTPSWRRYRHRHVLRLLEAATGLRDCYLLLASRFAVERKTPTEKSWDRRWLAVVKQIAEAIAGGPLTGVEVDAFLAWKEEVSSSQATKRPRDDNIYRYPEDDAKVHIRLGSIHSIKGETHTATLVLETFWNKHNLDKLGEWLVGSRANWKKADGVHQRSRLKTHYVAMTRPTHLVCLAMKKSSFDDDAVGKLEQRGWLVEHV
ncbi:MAG: UvrD-helicase domain-containing protein, partial [Deltaproteobacteria bacterium]|nr:UvrD-helicase domain-containing protein [Deltaproteobacteria bacterium]